MSRRIARQPDDKLSIEDRLAALAQSAKVREDRKKQERPEVEFETDAVRSAFYDLVVGKKTREQFDDRIRDAEALCRMQAYHLWLRDLWETKRRPPSFRVRQSNTVERDLEVAAMFQIHAVFQAPADEETAIRMLTDQTGLGDPLDKGDAFDAVQRELRTRACTILNANLTELRYGYHNGAKHVPADDADKELVRKLTLLLTPGSRPDALTQEEVERVVHVEKRVEFVDSAGLLDRACSRVKTFEQLCRYLTVFMPRTMFTHLEFAPNLSDELRRERLHWAAQWL